MINGPGSAKIGLSDDPDTEKVALKETQPSANIHGNNGANPEYELFYTRGRRNDLGLFFLFQSNIAEMDFFRPPDGV